MNDGNGPGPRAETNSAPQAGEDGADVLDPSASATPVADRIRNRLLRAGRRFHANDNISSLLEEGEVDEIQAEVEARMQDVLRALVIDTDSDHNTRDTARRAAFP